MRGADKARTSRSRQLRGDQTAAESLLWGRLRGRRLNGFKFVRQEPVGPFFGDFICREAQLIVEVDGATTHSTDAEIAHDERRDAFLRGEGHRVVRVCNMDVLDNLDGICELILAALERRETL
jgi:very-short-patch-repair endonuclease